MNITLRIPQTNFSSANYCDQLYSYLTKFGILSDCQFGFRKFHSTTTALLDCTNDWYVNLDRKLFNLVVLIDLKKAFDPVDHQILLRKLEFYGVKGQALSLLKSYLTNRNKKLQIIFHQRNQLDVGYLKALF